MNYFKKQRLDERAFPDLPSRSKLIPVAFWMLVIVIVFFIQTNIRLFGAALNLAVLIPFFIGVRKSPEKGLLAGIGIGLIQDSLSHAIIGPHILSKGMVGLISPLMSGKFFIWTPLFGIASLFAMTFLDGMVVYASMSIFQSVSSSLSQVLLDILIQSLINAPVGYFIRPRE